MPKKKAKIEAIVPRELPVYRYVHPYGSITLYSPAGNPLSPEKVLLLLKQAEFDILYKTNGR